MNTAVIIPAFNAAHFLPDTLSSVCAQTAAPSEIMVVDDGSTDHIRDVVAACTHARLIAQTNQGVSAARNRGAAEARSDWLLFLDADDRLTPDALKLFTACMTDHPGFNVYYGKVVRRYSKRDGRGLSSARGDAASEGSVPAAVRANFYRSAILAPGAVLINRRFFQTLGGFDTRYDTLADRDWYLRAGLVTPFKFCNGVVMEKYTATDTMSGNRTRALVQGLNVQLDCLERIRGSRPASDALRDLTAGRALNRALFRTLDLPNATEACHLLLAVARARHIETITSRLMRWAPSVAALQLKTGKTLGRAIGFHPNDGGSRSPHRRRERGTYSATPHH